jgi:small subunit ribosomal protein S20
MRNQIAKVRTAVEAGKSDDANAELRNAVSVIHHVVSKGIIHRNQAARKISRLNKAVKAIA